MFSYVNNCGQDDLFGCFSYLTYKPKKPEPKVRFKYSDSDKLLFQTKLETVAATFQAIFNLKFTESTELAKKTKIKQVTKLTRAVASGLLCPTL
jgi:hypothetical protein